MTVTVLNYDDFEDTVKNEYEMLKIKNPKEMLTNQLKNRIIYTNKEGFNIFLFKVSYNKHGN